MRKLLALLAIATLPFTSFAQSVEEFAAPPIIASGAISFYDIIRGSSMVQVPNKLAYLDGPWGAGYIYFINIVQTHTWFAGNMVQLEGGPTGAYSASHPPGGTMARSFSLSWHFFNHLSNRTTDKERFGRFEFSLIVRQSGSGGAPILFTKAWLVDWTPFIAEVSQYEPGTNPGSGGGVTPDDLNNQPVNTGGFWQNIFNSLFIPSEAMIADFKNTTAKWATWGPFGIYNIVTNKFAFYSGTLPQESYVLPFVGYQMDLTPYKTFIKFTRALMAGALYLIVIFAVWKRVHMKA